MKLIIIYGPPAVGKLTVAEKLSELTKIKIFHNHMTNDLVWNLFGRYKGEWDFINKLRREIIGEAAKLNHSLIFTSVYIEGDKGDKEDIHKLIQIVENHGGEVCFVHLICDKSELLKRVGSESRSKYKKLLDPKILDDMLEKEDFVSDLSFVKSLIINNTTLAPNITAQKVIDKFKLLP